ncbi:type II toxin-antitoxin system MqsA family antitoxin [Planctomycetota bacterium]
MPTGKPADAANEATGTCPLCAGPLKEGLYTVPLVLGESVLVIRDVPAEGCQQCGEPFLTSAVSERVQELAVHFQKLRTEVSVVRYVAA